MRCSVDTISNFSNSSTPFLTRLKSYFFSYTIPNTGSYTLGIGVVDVGEPTRISGLLVDKVEAVPEPSSTLNTGYAVFSSYLILALRRRQKTN